MRLGELEGTVGEEDGYTAEADAAILLDGLDIPIELHERKMGELQGGQKVRVLLAQALFGHPQALLLDEPTNHLDLDSIHWLQSFLNNYDGVVIVISHDRHFLNSVCTHIADIDYETIITYTGTYDDMKDCRIGLGSSCYCSAEAGSTSALQSKSAVLLLAHGSPETADEIPDFLQSITRGRPLPSQVIDEVTHRYSLIGFSPLTW